MSESLDLKWSGRERRLDKLSFMLLLDSLNYGGTWAPAEAQDAALGLIKNGGALCSAVLRPSQLCTRCRVCVHSAESDRITGTELIADLSHLISVESP